MNGEAQSDTKNGTARAADESLSCVPIAFPLRQDVGEPIHRMDTRLQKRFSLGGTVSVDGILELFNVFNACAPARRGNFRMNQQS